MSSYVEVRGVKIGEGVPKKTKEQIKSAYRSLAKQKKRSLQQQSLLQM